MSHYKSNLRDIEFNLFEVLRRQDVLGKPPYEELDRQAVRDVLAEVNRLAVGPLADSFAEADRNPPVFDRATGMLLRVEPAPLRSHEMSRCAAATAGLLPGDVVLGDRGFCSYAHIAILLDRERYPHGLVGAACENSRHLSQAAITLQLRPRRGSHESGSVLPDE